MTGRTSRDPKAGASISRAVDAPHDAAPDELVDVAVVGGGPAGAAIAGRISGAGLRTVLLEARPAWSWTAGGVFSSPTTMRELRLLGLDAATLEAVARPIPAMRVETRGGATIRLTYGADRGGEPPVGLDRSALDPALLTVTMRAGADVRRPVTVTRVDAAATPGGRATIEYRDGTSMRRLGARVVVGADGHRSSVARGLRVDRLARLGGRIGLTWHLAGVAGDDAMDARMVVLDGAYCGLAPVPGGRLNVGIVLANARWRRRLAELGAAAVGAEVLRSIHDDGALPPDWRDARIDDAIAGAAPLGHRVTRRAGPGWLLVGDAAGFLDPFTGEGLHRALVSARLGADAVIAALRADPVRRDDAALVGYATAMRRRFATKDVLSLLVQGFLARPTVFEYAARRLARRARVRATMGLVMGDLVPASRALDPRFLAALLLP